MYWYRADRHSGPTRVFGRSPMLCDIQETVWVPELAPVTESSEILCVTNAHLICHVLNMRVS
jgi:hypothetical protein